MPAQNFKKQKTRFFVLAFAMSFFVLAMMGLIVVFVFNPVEEESLPARFLLIRSTSPERKTTSQSCSPDAHPRKKMRFFSHWFVWICWAAGFLLFCSRPKLRWMLKPDMPPCLRLIKKAGPVPPQRR